MSTKTTLAYGPNFHLYQDLLDDGSVFLELEGVAFETKPGSVMVQIPISTWEAIRHHTDTAARFAHLTDEEIQSLVEGEVDNRLSRYEQGGHDASMGLAGYLPYGPVESPREAQIAAGVSYFKRLRARRRVIAQEASTS